MLNTLLLDVNPGPVQSVGWGITALFLIIILVLSVAFAGGLVVFLIWFKRRKMRATESLPDARN